MRADIVEKRVQNLRRFRAGFDGERYPVMRSVFRQFFAGLGHDAVARMMGIRRHHADMRGDHRGAQIDRQIADAGFQRGFGCVGAVGVPVNAGELANTSGPVPVSFVTAAARLAEVGVMSHAGTPAPSENACAAPAAPVPP